MTDYLTTDSDLEAVADAIRAKGATSALLVYPNGFVSAINAIPTGITPTGTKSITISAAGTTTEDVANYANAEITVPSGSATTPATSVTATPTISVSSGGLITASVSTTKSVTPSVSAGYVSSGTAGTVGVSGSNTKQLDANAARVFHPSLIDDYLFADSFNAGLQTFKAVVLTNLLAANIKEGVTVKVGDSTDDECVTSVTGTYSGGGGVSTVTAGIMAMAPQMVPIYFVDASGVFHEEEDSFDAELVAGSSIVVKYAGTSLPPSYFLTNLQFVANVKITSTDYLLFYKAIENS